MRTRGERAQIKPAYLIGVALIVLFGAMTVYSFVGAQTRYATVLEARSGSYLAVKGDVDHASRHFDSKRKCNSFDLIDKGERLAVEYVRPLPANFDQVKQVVVKGKFREGVFEADEVLTK